MERKLTISSVFFEGQFIDVLTAEKALIEIPQMTKSLRRFVKWDYPKTKLIG